jgi:carboxyl-terminal processing protease
MNYNNSKRSIFLPVMLGISLAIGVVIGRYLPVQDVLPKSSNIRSRNDKLNSILNIVESNYVDSVNRNDLVETAIPAMLKKLDPH